MELKTPLYDTHIARGGKIVPFAGYLLPVQYEDISKEHLAVRKQAGLFDVSHMGEIIVSGPDVLSNLNYMLTNDFTNMEDGRVRYSPMCNEDGGIVDDLIVYRLSQDRYLIVVNAANRHKDVEFMKQHLKGDVVLEDASDHYAQLALQGPKSKEILSKLVDPARIPEKYYTFINHVKVAGIDCLVSQTGYTGEHGYELYCDPKDAVRLWEEVLEAGEAEGLIPCGLGARDTLRLEAAMPLYGHEMTDHISPLEVGLGFAVKMQKEDFVGKAGIEKRGEPKVKRVGFKVTGRGIVREENPVYIGDIQIGVTTSGTHCPYLGGAYAMGMVEVEHAVVGTEVEIEVRKRKIKCEIIPLPFYKKA
ncbi:MAG TPA: glycine cleavage system aminomethyltransferase GcvT [Candidatus Merdenecus merdavium]|nr:glycine cleavage system aminomethyltransferase GcvT [Candidatus Merdenecus merdavium]